MNLQIAQLLSELKTKARTSGFEIETFDQIEKWPLMALSRNSSRQGGQKVYISSGIHGDEPAGPLALLELLESDALPRQHDYWICPVLNPAGLDAGTRENTDGLDLNRDYREPQSSEIRAHISWAKQHIPPLDLALHLHEDWEAKGFYLYELNFSGQPGHANAILEAAAKHLPIDTTNEIDGSPASGGIIRPQTLPELEEGYPEAIYFQQQFGGLNYTLETPSGLPLKQRIAAHKDAILTVL
ncbi:MAG: M14 family metallocarboxypeptidase [Verrucomicrobiota bacterium]